MSDPDQPGEDFDEERLPEEYPPEEPLAAEDQGVTGLEQLGGESLEEREERTEPEVWRRRRQASDQGRSPVVEEAGQPMEEEASAQLPVEQETSVDPLAPDDQVSGDETTRDVAPERTPQPAEEAAVRDEEQPGPR